ncbi:uncharacterized protein PITG_08860 [Phytophthora infestans T30-4]|uniref:Uncharacterized protein n=1 Tax=Phytophthora infestans (strain T30-4) TaxID=403677 RepID=D0NDC8_PHYIT|nr:uncharacterized protein PITG_08860 [Phytophthora infestans T30-4]EEY56085.1 conserved hypothetical protein [Phytophthora infestans T30-4]|eukprot:XP_002902915.1 conserved hypothetical protein [Phytophthora infestans T30-4]
MMDVLDGVDTNKFKKLWRQLVKDGWKARPPTGLNVGHTDEIPMANKVVGLAVLLLWLQSKVVGMAVLLLWLQNNVIGLITVLRLVQNKLDDQITVTVLQDDDEMKGLEWEVFDQDHCDMALVNGFTLHRMAMERKGKRAPKHAEYMRQLHVELLAVTAISFRTNRHAEDLASVRPEILTTCCAALMNYTRLNPARAKGRAKADSISASGAATPAHLRGRTRLRKRKLEELSEEDSDNE